MKKFKNMVSYFNEVAMNSVLAADAMSREEEAQFSLAELFFSRTDSRGVIRSGNSVFQRVSRFPWDELLGAPHKIIRHPDMPKGVFWLLWDTIRSGRPIGAYVKNRSKDGRYYWVFAIVTPIDDGYLSVRIKPTSPLLKRVIDEYAGLRTLESAGDLTPEQSAEAFLTRLRNLDFDSYGSFMTHAITQEIKYRSKGLNRTNETMTKNFSTMLVTLDTVIKEGESITSYTDIDQAINMDTLSQYHPILADEIRTRIKEFSISSQDVFARINHGMFLACTCALQQEVIAQFDADTAAPDTVSKVNEIAALNAQNARYVDEAETALCGITNEVSRFVGVCDRLKHSFADLNRIGVSSEDGAPRADYAVGGVGEIVSRLRRFQSMTEECLGVIESESLTLLEGLRGQITAVDGAQERHEPGETVRRTA